MDDEVTQILKKWNLKNPAPTVNSQSVINHNENFDSRTFTRPKKMAFTANSSSPAETGAISMESGVR